MKYIGKYGEYRVLACLLEYDVEAYSAIKANQKDYDITAVLNTSKVVRIQVKSTLLNNKSTNNSIDRIDKNYDFLVIVVIDDDFNPNFYVLTKEEAIQSRGNNKGLSVTCRKAGRSCVVGKLLGHKDAWDKILSKK